MPEQPIDPNIMGVTHEPVVANMPRRMHFGPAPDPTLVPPVDSEPQKLAELRRWWMDTAEREIDPLIAKMIEYGGEGRAVDLINIGRTMAESGITTSQSGSLDTRDIEVEYTELGIYFYLVGKFARWQAAIEEGRSVSDDTLHDIGVYVRMAQRARVTGGWPQ